MLDRDGILDLRIEGRARSGLPTKHALLGPLKKLVHDFVSDGAHFRPLSVR